MIKVGFIGLGHISHENVLGYLNRSDVLIVAVCSLERAQADEWLKRWRLTGVRWYGDYEKMLEAESLDIVEILTPHHLHCAMAVRCAKARVRGISLQKPMGITIGECSQVIEACRRHHVKLKVYENFVFYPPYLKAKELITAGVIGDPLSVRVHTMAGVKEGASWPWCFSPNTWRTNLGEAGMGPLVGDDGFHKFSLARWFMGRDFEKVSAWIDADTPLDAPAYIRAKFRSQPGETPRYAQLDFTFSPRMAIPCDFWLDEFVEIVGERGVMWINQCSAAGDRAMFPGNEMSRSPVFPPLVVFVDGRVTTYLTDIPLSERNWSSSFIASTQHFIRAVQEDSAPIYTGEDGMEITRYIIAALVSAQDRRDVYLEEITAENEAAGCFQVRSNFCNLQS